MEIKLDEATKREIIEQAKQQLITSVLAQFNPKQIAAEIKNEVVSKAAKELANRYAEKYNANEAIQRAVQSAESRANDKIRKLLEKGINISFKDLD